MKIAFTILTVFLSIQVMGQTTSGTISSSAGTDVQTEINVNDLNFLLPIDAPMEGAIVAIKNEQGSEVILQKVYGDVRLSLKDLRSGTYALNIRDNNGATITEATLIIE